MEYDFDCIISVSNYENWGINTDFLKDSILSRYPNANLSNIGNGIENELFFLLIELNHKTFTMSIWQRSIHISGSFKEIVEMSLFLRRIIPLNRKLLLYDNTFTYDIEVGSETSSEEIYEAFNLSFPN